MVPRDACFCLHEGYCSWAHPRPGRGSFASLARLVFSELAAQVAPLVEGAGPQDELWEFLKVFLRHSGGVLKAPEGG